MDTSATTNLIIIGITGDLAKRKLLPAVEELASIGHLPKDFNIIGITRRNVDTSELIGSIPDGPRTLKFVEKKLKMYRMDLENKSHYIGLRDKLASLSGNSSSKSQTLCYLSVPPQVSDQIVESLGAAGFGNDSNFRLLLEKPFGTDYESALDMVNKLKIYFSEEQTYRIDHYLAKEMAQNIVIFRNGNSLFKKTWNNQFIERIEIIASENIGIESRAAFYEQTGALRDVVQNHLMQLASLVLMELPEPLDWHRIPVSRRNALAQLKLPPPNLIDRYTYRAQYEGYTEETGNPGSQTETFAAITLFSSDPKWADVPVVLASGKGLKEKTSEIRIYYRKQHNSEANRLTLRIQPKEGIGIDLWSKQPGYDRKLMPVQIEYNYHQAAKKLPDAYEQVILDAIQGNNILFTSSDEILTAWKILMPVQHAWSMTNNKLPTYKKDEPIDRVARRDDEEPLLVDLG